MDWAHAEGHNVERTRFRFGTRSLFLNLLCMATGACKNDRFQCCFPGHNCSESNLLVKLMHPFDSSFNIRFARGILAISLLVIPAHVVAVQTVTSESTPSAAEMSVIRESYGTTSDGQAVTRFVCTNRQGNAMSLIDYGATMVSLEMPDREGDRANIILTCDGMTAWEACQSYFGSVAGRYCNRIAMGHFTLDGKEYELAVNNGPNHLHGGVKGFDKVMWRAEPVETSDAVGVQFSYRSPDGEEGYPGNLDVVAEYRLTNENEVTIEFRATTDKPTHVNLTNHNYWNLGGNDSGTHLEHELQVEADKVLETDATLIPTGSLLDVAGTPLDFRKFRRIGDRIDEVGDDVKGYDHCFVIRDHNGEMRHVATVRDPASGREMEIHSTQPGLQFYTGNFLDGGEGSCGYAQYSGFCLETQHFPDTPNHDEFPSTRLDPGDEFVEKTILRFRAR